MAALFDIVGRRHGVGQHQVREAAGHRALSFDGLTIGSLALVFGLVARRLIRNITKGSLASSPLLLTVTLAVVSIALAMAGFGAGAVWSGLAETIRLGNGHASYRIERIPWRQYPLEIFISAVVLFWLIAAYQFRRGANLRAS